jgi:hypothetical protein
MYFLLASILLTSSQPTLTYDHCGDKDGLRVNIPSRDDVLSSKNVNHVIFTDKLAYSAEVHDDDCLVDVRGNADNASASNNGSGDEVVIPARDKRRIKRPVRHDDFVMFAEHHEPESYSDAMQSENSDEWNRVRYVMNEETDS